MFGRIRDIFGKQSTTRRTSTTQSFSDKETATAVLLVEAATLDGHFDAQEHETIRRALVRLFSLEEASVESLITEAREIQKKSSQLQGLTRTIKKYFDEKERIELIEMLWEVVYADGELCDYESNLMRRIGGLIYVSERERGEARKRVLARLEPDP